MENKNQQDFLIKIHNKITRRKRWNNAIIQISFIIGFCMILINSTALIQTNIKINRIDEFWTEEIKSETEFYYWTTTQEISSEDLIHDFDDYELDELLLFFSNSKNDLNILKLINMEG